MAAVRHALRQVLRTVDQHLTRVNDNKLWRTHVINLFRRLEDADPEKQRQLLQQAKDYAYLVNSVQEHRVSSLYQYNQHFAHLHCGCWHAGTAVVL